MMNIIHNQPDLKDEHYGIVKHLLHKLWFVWGDFFSLLVHHVLQINLIEAKFNIININDLANNYDIKPECATERVDDNLWNIIFTTSSLQELKCNTHQAST